MLVCKNLVSIDLRVLSECLPKINRYRTTPFLMALYKSIMSDSLHPELMDEHDSYFKPNTQPEKDLWTSCRKLAKKEMITLIKSVKGGQEGGRPKKLTPEGNKAKAHNMLEIFGNSFKTTDAVVGVFDGPDGTTREGIQIKNPRLMAFVRQRFDKQVLNKVSDWATDHNQRGHTYNATALLKLLCKFQSNVEPDINFNHVQSEYLTFKFKGE